jgi:hypothetical protein
MNQILIEEINKNKRLMNLLENDLVKLSNTSYSNVKYDNDATKNDLVTKALLDDIQKAADSVGVTATITTAKSGHNVHVKNSKRTSRHMKNVAVDVAILNGIGSGGASNSRNGNAEFRRLGNKLKNALVSMGYSWNRESGNDKAVLWQTNTGGNHYNHLHISNRTGVSSGIDIDSEDSDTEETTSTSFDSAAKGKLDNILNSTFNGSSIKDLIGGEETSTIETLNRIFKTISSFTS